MNESPKATDIEATRAMVAAWLKELDIPYGSDEMHINSLALAWVIHQAEQKLSLSISDRQVLTIATLRDLIEAILAAKAQP